MNKITWRHAASILHGGRHEEIQFNPFYLYWQSTRTHDERTTNAVRMFLGLLWKTKWLKESFDRDCDTMSQECWGFYDRMHKRLKKRKRNLSTHNRYVNRWKSSVPAHFSAPKKNIRKV